MRDVPTLQNRILEFLFGLVEKSHLKVGPVYPSDGSPAVPGVTGPTPAVASRAPG